MGNAAKDWRTCLWPPPLHVFIGIKVSRGRFHGKIVTGRVGQVATSGNQSLRGSFGESVGLRKQWVTSHPTCKYRMGESSCGHARVWRAFPSLSGVGGDQSERPRRPAAPLRGSRGIAFTLLAGQPGLEHVSNVWPSPAQKRLQSCHCRVTQISANLLLSLAPLPYL